MLKRIVEGGGSAVGGAVLSVAEGDSLADAEGLEEEAGLAAGDATMAGISFALVVVSFRTGFRTAGGFGLGDAITTTAAEGVDTGLTLWGWCFRVTAPTAADPATMTARAAAVTRSPVVTKGAVTAGAAVELAARSVAG